jgi:hypothetical protein
MLKSCVLILPINLRDEGDRMGETLGWGPNNFSVPLITIGSNEVTHYGLHAWVDDTFIAMLDDPTITQQLLDSGFTQEQYSEIYNSIIKSYRNDYINHFNEVISENNLAVDTGE